MSFTDRPLLSPEQRRERNREEMSAAILEAARQIMREHGAGGLNLNQLAKLVHMTTPALYSYFSNKEAIYDALYQLGIRLVREQEQRIWRETEPDWERLHRWFTARLDFAVNNPELYQLMFGNPVPGFVPSQASALEAKKQLESARDGLAAVIESGVINPGIPTERAVDLMLAFRHGIVAEQVGKANVVPAGSDRFTHLIDDAINVLKRAWGAEPGQHSVEGVAPG